MYNQTRGAVKLVKEHPLMDPKNDLAFKLLFGQPRSAEMLMAFLNALLYRTGADKITAIEFANSEFAGDHKEDRGSRLDVYVRTDAGEHINIEMYTRMWNTFACRMCWRSILWSCRNSGICITHN